MIGSTSSRRTGPPTVPGGRAAGILADTRAALEAARDIERVIARSRGDTQPVFEAITRAALTQCHATSACVFTYDGALVHIGAATFSDPTGSDMHECAVVREHAGRNGVAVRQHRARDRLEHGLRVAARAGEHALYVCLLYTSDAADEL